MGLSEFGVFFSKYPLIALKGLRMNSCKYFAVNSHISLDTLWFLTVVKLPLINSSLKEEDFSNLLFVIFLEFIFFKFQIVKLFFLFTQSTLAVVIDEMIKTYFKIFCKLFYQSKVSQNRLEYRFSRFYLLIRKKSRLMALFNSILVH